MPIKKEQNSQDSNEKKRRSAACLELEGGDAAVRGISLDCDHLPVCTTPPPPTVSDRLYSAAAQVCEEELHELQTLPAWNSRERSVLRGVYRCQVGLLI